VVTTGSKGLDVRAPEAPVGGDEYVKDFRGTVERAGEMGRCDRRLVRRVKPLGLGESEPLHDVGERPAEVALVTVLMEDLLPCALHHRAGVEEHAVEVAARAGAEWT
jgi:hypothetical protein